MTLPCPLTLIRRAAAAAIVLLLTASPTFAAPVGREYWREAAEEDVRAAYMLIEVNHPAAVRALHDQRFRTALAAAYALAARRAQKVGDYDAYRATLGAFANSLGDKHIWSRPTYVIDRPEWPGFLPSKRGNQWVITQQAEGSDGALIGATLASCDGIAPEVLARRSLGQFRVNWSIGAQQVQSAPWLLVDEHNPFFARPKVCALMIHGREKAIALQWSKIHREDLLQLVKRAGAAGSAGFGVRRVGGGIWIALGNLLDPAAPVVEEVERRSSEIRRAPFVIVDVRGNGGGSSVFGTRIAEAIWGKEFIARKEGDADAECDDVWRASDGNIVQLQSFVRELGPTRGPEFVRIVSGMIERARAARAKGLPWIMTASCGRARPKPRQPAAEDWSRREFKGPVLLVTDNRCFSSCLAMTREFRSLGAVQVGQTTDANTHYSEVRETLLPSGMSYFSTLQAFAPGTPLQLGPFEPAYLFGGDIADDHAVEEWALKVASSLVSSDPRKSSLTRSRNDPLQSIGGVSQQGMR